MIEQNECYLCQSQEFSYRPGSVRDNPDLKVCECDACGLVYLSSFAHVLAADLYEESGMHGEQPLDITKWLADTEVDDERRFHYFKPKFKDKSILDFGCGAGGFLSKAKGVASEVYGVELEKRLQGHFRENGLTVYENLDSLKTNATVQFDMITLFHVLEHLADPRHMLQELSGFLAPGGEIIIEVPHANDALLTLYDCEPFSHFTYWSCHLFLFTEKTLTTLVGQAGLKVNAVKQIQRYPLANHLHWLAKGKPGGHTLWDFLDSPEMQQAYEKSLADIGQSDTLLMSIST